MEVFGIEPSAIIGTLKEYVKNAIMDGVIENNFEAANRLMIAKAGELGLMPVNPVNEAKDEEPQH